MGGFRSLSGVAVAKTRMTFSAGGHGSEVLRSRMQSAISVKTADHHIQHVYTKIGVATLAAALWAMQHALAGSAIPDRNGNEGLSGNPNRVICAPAHLHSTGGLKLLFKA